jgi:hypothetical protein
MLRLYHSDLNSLLPRRVSEIRTRAGVHSAWLRVMRYCAELSHGEIEKLKIQDGLPRGCGGHDQKSQIQFVVG